MIEKFRPKFVEGRDGVGRRTGGEGGCQAEPESQGKEGGRAAGPCFPLRRPASVVVVVIHLQGRTRGKVSP